MIGSLRILQVLSGNGGLPSGWAVVNGDTLITAKEYILDTHYQLLSGFIDPRRYYLQINQEMLTPKLSDALWDNIDAMLKAGDDVLLLIKLL